MQEILERVEALEHALDELRREKQAVERERDSAVRRARWQAAGLLALVVLATLLLPGQAAEAQLTLAQRVTALEQKLVHWTRSGNNVILTGANLHIRNGGGKTDTANGLGNLILGYGEKRPFNPDGTNPNRRGGSHNLVLGYAPNYTSYGGIVSGQWNDLEAPYAVACGGRENLVRGTGSAVTGGWSNAVTGYGAVIAGGYRNRAFFEGAVATGGWENYPGNNYATVSGGRRVIQSYVFGWAAGGDTDGSRPNHLGTYHAP